MRLHPEENYHDLTLDIEDYSGRNFDTDVLDTIVETSHADTAPTEPSSDDILDEDHWAADSFVEDVRVEEEY